MPFDSSKTGTFRLHIKWPHLHCRRQTKPYLQLVCSSSLLRQLVDFGIEFDLLRFVSSTNFSSFKERKQKTMPNIFFKCLLIRECAK